MWDTMRKCDCGLMYLQRVPPCTTGVGSAGARVEGQWVGFLLNVKTKWTGVG